MSHEPPPDLFSETPAPNNPPPPNAASVVAPVQPGGPLRRVLPWIVSAAAVLGLMLVMLFAVLPRVSQVPHPVKNPPLPSDSAAVLPQADPALPPLVPARPSPAQPAMPKTAADGQVPLGVTLYSAGGGKHVSVGKPVLISAYAALPPTGSATIAISYTRNGGPRSLLTLAQGSLSTASWTPAVPGRYDFTASALDSRKISTFSRSLVIVADAAPSPLSPLPVAVSPAPPPARTAALVSAHRAEPVPRRRAAQDVPAARPAPKRPKMQTSHLKPYHVAAAAFVVRPVAETLAGALRRRGFHAFVRETKQPHHKPTYVVETGKFLRPADAKKQLYTLNHDGYPAFVSQ